MNPALRALNRFGLGARPGEASRLGDPRGWLEAQLEGEPPLLADPAVDERRELIEVWGDATERGANTEREVQQTVRRLLSRVQAAERQTVLNERLASDRPFLERLAAFWSNHLCVSMAAAGTVDTAAGPYEREAIRPHVLGRFEEMVIASARHPAMLLYLDNSSSIGPESTAGLNAGRRGRGRGLNENYARELLELHTLGVDGGYTQDDVIELARVLTGWGLAVRGAPGDSGGPTSMNLVRGRVEFAFYPNRHQPGAHTVLGKRYAQPDVEQGEAVIRDLCAHPATARFVATKLVRHFVADEPPARAVDAVSAEFTRSGGDLRRVASVLIGLPEAWDERNRKLRTPQDWLTAVLRAFEVQEVPANLRGALGALRQPLWGPPAPKGWGDTRAEWADPDSLMNRAELARTMATRSGRLGGRVEPAALVELIDVAPTDPIHALVADASIDVEKRIALVLAGPAFQWR